MANPEIFDKARYHLDGDFPDDLPDDQAFVHTGFFLGWLADNGLLAAEFESDFSAEISALRSREISAPQLYSRVGGCFDGSMVSKIARQFVATYFDFETGRYLRDYREVLATDLPSIYHVKDDWFNYDRICAKISLRFREYNSMGGASRSS